MQTKKSPSNEMTSLYQRMLTFMVRMFISDLVKMQVNPASDIVFCIHIRLPKQSKRKDRYYADKNKLTYRQVGDYLIPNLTLPPEEARIQIGKWGMLHKDYIQKHKPVVFVTLLAQGKLWQYLADIDTQAREMFDILVEQMREREGVGEQLKEENQMLWVQTMNNIQDRANEIVCCELIYV